MSKKILISLSFGFLFFTLISCSSITKKFGLEYRIVKFPTDRRIPLENSVSYTEKKLTKRKVYNAKRFSDEFGEIYENYVYFKPKEEESLPNEEKNQQNEENPPIKQEEISNDKSHSLNSSTKQPDEQLHPITDSKNSNIRFDDIKKYIKNDNEKKIKQELPKEPLVETKDEINEKNNNFDYKPAKNPEKEDNIISSPKIPDLPLPRNEISNSLIQKFGSLKIILYYYAKLKALIH